MPQPYPDPSGFNSSLSVIEYANIVTDGWMGTLFMLAMVSILFVICQYNRYKLSDSLLASFFISFCLGSMLWAVGLIAGKIIVLFLLMTIACGIYSYLDED